MPGDWILVVDDHPLFAAAVTDIVTQLAPETGVEIADSVAAARALVTRLGAPRLALLDLNLPDSPASRSLEALGAMADGAPVVVISAHDDPLRVRQAMAAGAVGFILPSWRKEAAYWKAISRAPISILEKQRLGREELAWGARSWRARRRGRRDHRPRNVGSLSLRTNPSLCQRTVLFSSAPELSPEVAQLLQLLEKTWVSVGLRHPLRSLPGRL